MTTTAPRAAEPSSPPSLAPRPFGAAGALGALTIFLVLAQIASGILLAFYYEPTMEAAHPSVVYLVTRVTGGWLVHSIHDWLAEALLVSLVLYLACVFFTHGYRGPGRRAWAVGVAFLGVLLAFRFSGDLLPFDQRAYAITAVGDRLVGELPVAGPALQGIAFGGDTVSDATLSRFHTGHLLVLPWAAFGLGVAYFALARGSAAPAPRGAGFLAAAGASLVLGLAVLVSAFWPVTLGDPVTRLDIPARTLPHWSFAGLHTFLRLFPEGARASGVGVALACWVLPFSWPFIEPRLPARHQDRASRVLGLLVCGTVIALTMSTYRG